MYSGANEEVAIISNAKQFSNQFRSQLFDLRSEEGTQNLFSAKRAIREQMMAKPQGLRVSEGETFRQLSAGQPP